MPLSAGHSAHPALVGRQVSCFGSGENTTLGRASWGVLAKGPRIYEMSTGVIPLGNSSVLTCVDTKLVSHATAGTAAVEIDEETATTLKLLSGYSVVLSSTTLNLTRTNRPF